MVVATHLLYLPVSQSNDYPAKVMEILGEKITTLQVRCVGARARQGREGKGIVYILRDLIKYFNGPTKTSLISHKV